MKDFTLKVKNLEYLNKLFKVQISKYNDLYLFPSFPTSPKLASSGLHISFHASGASHLRFNPPVACLRLGPNVMLPFDRSEFVDDVAAKKKTLFKHIDMSNETRGDLIAVLKTGSMFRNLFNSRYIRNLFRDHRFIDYYNLILTNPYRPSSDFREYFPYKEIEIDAEIVQDSIYVYEDERIYSKLIELKNKGVISEVDIIGAIPYDTSFAVIMNGKFMGIRFNPNDVDDIINKLPGAVAFITIIKKLGSFF
jgi:hypothetical protein